MCPEQDSNLHTSRHAHLKRTRLPIPPSGQKKRAENETRTRDPDLGKVVLYQLSYFRILFCCVKEHCFRKAGAKVQLFFDMTKYFRKKMQKNFIFVFSYRDLCDFLRQFEKKEVLLQRFLRKQQIYVEEYTRYHR